MNPAYAAPSNDMVMTARIMSSPSSAAHQPAEAHEGHRQTAGDEQDDRRPSGDRGNVGWVISKFIMNIGVLRGEDEPVKPVLVKEEA